MFVQNIFLNGSENCLAFQPFSSYFTTFTGTNKTSSLQSKRILEESIKLHLYLTIFASEK